MGDARDTLWVPKKINILIKITIGVLINLISTNFPIPWEYILLWYTYYVQITDNRYYSNISKMDAHYIRMLVLGKVRFPWNQAIHWHHFPIEQTIVKNCVLLKTESAGAPIVVASEDFLWYGVFRE